MSPNPARPARRAGAQHGEVARRIAEPFRLLERAVVFLVHDDQWPGERQHREPRPEDDARVAGLGRAPVRQALRLVERAMEAHEPRSRETRLHHRFELRRQRDLGNEHQHLPAALHDLVRETKIDLGLAAAGDTQQQERGELADLPVHGRDGVRLCGSELMNRRRVGARARLCARGARRVVSFGGLRSRNGSAFITACPSGWQYSDAKWRSRKSLGLETRTSRSTRVTGFTRVGSTSVPAATSTITPTAVRLPNGTTARRPTSASDASSN